MRRITLLVICMLVLALGAGSALAATTTPPPDTLKVDYFANANTAGAPDGTLRLDNPGTAGGSVCANVYVFDPQQEMTECCSCLITPDGLRTLSVNTDLTGNPLTGKALTTGVIKLVSNVVPAGGCPAYPTTLNSIQGGVRAWVTHIQNSNFSETETASQDATLVAAEVNRLNSQCNAIKLDGSGSGQCTCGTGD